MIMLKSTLVPLVAAAAATLTMAAAATKGGGGDFPKEEPLASDMAADDLLSRFQVFRTADNSCQRYIFGQMHDCSGYGAAARAQQQDQGRPCRDVGANNDPTIVVSDSTGRLGNHMFSYMFLLSIQVKYGFEAFLSEHSHNVLAPYFRNLSLPVAEDHLCGFRQGLASYRERRFRGRIEFLKESIRAMAADHPVDLKLSPSGSIQLPPDLTHLTPQFQKLIHSKEFGSIGTDTLTTSGGNYSWDVFRGSFDDLGQVPRAGRALYIEETVPTRETFQGLEAKLDEAFVFHDDLLKMAQRTLDDAVGKWTTTKAKAKNGKAVRKVTVVGVHSRRSDHLSFQDQKGLKRLTSSYYLEAMDLFRNKYKKKVMFLFVSDDPEWGKRALGTYARKTGDLFFAGRGVERDRDSIGHDLALMSLCDHVIVSHGTFSFWAGFLANGTVITPNHFPKFRSERDGSPYLDFGNPAKALDHPQPRLYSI